MSRTERRVNELVDDDEEMAAAISTVKRAAEEDGGTVEWSDVSDDITSGQWGRIVEEGIVVDDEDEDGAFRLADPDAVDAALSDGTDVETDTDIDLEIDVGDPPESDGWSRYDKAAAVGAALVGTGYAFDPVRNVIEAVVNPILLPLDQVLPFYGVILIVALATATYSTLLQANLINTEVVQFQQKRMKAVRERQQEAEDAGDEAAQEALQKKQMEMMGEQMSMMKEQFKPTVWIMLLTIPAFLWLLTAVNNPGSIEGLELSQMVFPMRGRVEWTDSILGPMQAWIVWYILGSIAFGQVLRKQIDFSMTSD